MARTPGASILNLAKAFIPQVTISAAIGPTKDIKNDGHFNDLQVAGNWPTVQVIKRIKRITVYYTDSNVVGLKVQYQLVEGVTPNIIDSPHGLVIDAKFNHETIEFKDTELLVGAFGGQTQDGVIAKLGFLIFDQSLTAKNPLRATVAFGSTSSGLQTFASYGNIIAFIGSQNSSLGLRSLGFVKTNAMGYGNLF